jgi:hypothetical protein
VLGGFIGWSNQDTRKPLVDHSLEADGAKIFKTRAFPAFPAFPVSLDQIWPKAPRVQRVLGKAGKAGKAGFFEVLKLIAPKPRKNMFFLVFLLLRTNYSPSSSSPKSAGESRKSRENSFFEFLKLIAPKP